jgi:hypothetical protein
MPWKVEDVEGIKKGLTVDQKETWVEVANKALASCEADDGSDCEASAIKQANSVVSKLGESVSLADSIREALEKHDARLKDEHHEETVERTEMTFDETSGVLVPQEVGE